MATTDPLDDILTAARLQPDTLVSVRQLIQASGIDILRHRNSIEKGASNCLASPGFGFR